MENIDFNKLLLGIDSDVCTIEYGKIRSINFDNAATTPPFRKVIEAISDLGQYYGSIGRGAGQKAEITTSSLLLIKVLANLLIPSVVLLT